MRKIITELLIDYFKREFEFVCWYNEEGRTVDFDFLFSTEIFLMELPAVLSACYGLALPDGSTEEDAYLDILKKKFQDLSDFQGEGGTEIAKIVDVFIDTLGWDVPGIGTPLAGAVFTPVSLNESDELVLSLGYRDSMVHYTDRNNIYYISSIGNPAPDELLHIFLAQNCSGDEYSDFFELAPARARSLAWQMIQFEYPKHKRPDGPLFQQVHDEATAHRITGLLFEFLGKNAVCFSNAGNAADPFNYPGHMCCNYDPFAGCDNLCFAAVNKDYLIFVEQFWNVYCES